MLLTVVKGIHKLLVKEFGGTDGLRSQAQLESALARPYATFDGEDLYPSIADKAATLLESILINHPFVDGNKRTGYTLMRLMLLENGLDILASEHEKYKLVVAVAAGEAGMEDIKRWLDKYVIRY